MMKEVYGLPRKGVAGRIVIVLLLLSTECLCTPSDLDTTTSTAPPPHRGAARQMYGSGSLRPPGSAPRPSSRQPSSTPPNGSRRAPMQPPQTYLYPFSIGDFRGFPGGYPILVRGDGRPMVLSKSRNGLRFPPYHGQGRERYPVEYGRIPGRGFGDVDFMPRRYLPIRTKSLDRHHGGKVRLQEEDDAYLHPCGDGCSHNQYLCLSSCNCIDMELRCNGQMDCDGEEDELECGETELSRNTKCDDSETMVKCPLSGKCIKREWLCDGDDDCGDYSDETRCGEHHNCTSDQFECANGLCIQRTWLCDNDNDCRDFSDELNCTKTGCTDDEFTCKDGSCISLSWKCDRQIDCPDGADENECDFEPPVCIEGEFPCTYYQKCIRKEFKCDSDNDCGDWSDEDDCPKQSGTCSENQFRCDSGKCIPERFRCDKLQDCENNEDEKDCTSDMIRTCSPDENACNDGACIRKTWFCDGVPDCNDGEDELKCEIVCDDTKFACSGSDLNDTSTEFCISKKHVCDGRKDCPKGEDEKNCPVRKPCEKGSSCSQVCVTTPDGKNGCACNPGFKLAADGVTCNDIDECAFETDPVCSQTCTNTVGSFECGCMTGYILRPDLRSCKALGGHPTLLFANRADIRQVSLSNSKYTQILKGLHNTIALDYHYAKGLIFFSDVLIDVIRSAYINGSGVTDIIKWGLESPTGIAVDWIHDLVFWTDSGTRRIEVASLDGKQRAIVTASDLDKPRAIVVHPGEALLFWTDWGPNPKIERAEMDGRNRRPVVNESVFWPNGLTIDYTTNRIYWADAKHNVIETAFLDGSDRKKVISKGLPHPFALTIFEDAIYWTDWHTKSISTANKATGTGLKTIHSNLHFPMDIHSFHPQRQPSYRNHCGTNNGGCESMCLPNKNSYSCVCHMGQKLRNDRRTCQKPDKLLLFARAKDLRIKHLDTHAAHQHPMVIPLEGVKSAVALAWDSHTDTVFWTDMEQKFISKANWNGSEQVVIVDTNLESPSGIAYDWITNKIYWTDMESNRIEVVKTDGSMRSLLIWDGLDSPRDIILDPIAGYMYWSSWGSNPKIERAALDGTMRSVIVQSNLTWPIGLTIDYWGGKLYWADGGTKTIEYSNFDGSGRTKLQGLGDLPHPSGLDVFENLVYWIDWNTKNIESANKLTGANRTIIAPSVSEIMDVRVFHRSRKYVKSPCGSRNGGCSHLCLLKPKGHTCACPTGVLISKDNKTCPAGPTNYLILAHRTVLRQISLDVPYIADVVLPFERLKKAISVDVDRKTGEIYWSDTSEDVIQKGTLGGEIQPVIFHELHTPDGIAIDSTGRKIYWTDGGRNSIEVSELNGKNRKVLVWSDLDNPRAITLHYHHGLVFWSDWGKKGKIEVAHMDGTHRKALVTDRLIWPNGLAIDRPANRLYWNDGKLNVIESSDLDGKNRKTIVKNVEHPYGLVVVGIHIYWTDWETAGLHRADKNNGSDPQMIRGKLIGLMEVRSVQNDNIAENACGSNNGGCSHLCLRNPTSFTCACPTGLKMKKDSNKTCESVPSTYLIVAARFSLVRISFDTDDYWDVSLPIPFMTNAVDVDFHYEKGLIFYTDLDQQVIQSVSIRNLSDVKTVVSGNLSSPDGVAVDWVANNIYWTNTGNKVIEVARLDGSHRMAVITEGLKNPRSIAVFPRKGYLYWTDWGTVKIERSLLDGSSRTLIADKDLTFPVGLTIDYDNRRLYWIDAKLKAQTIEHTDLHGNNRIQLHLQDVHPFSLTQLGSYIYWSDWQEKTVYKAEKINGGNPVVVRSGMEQAMGITMVTAEKQRGWNPCAVDNGRCSHLCFFKHGNYTCGCPEGAKGCKTEPKSWVSTECQSSSAEECVNEHEDDENSETYYYPTLNPIDEAPEHKDTGKSTYFVMTVVSLLCITLVIVAGIFGWFIRSGKKNYMYPTGRSFSNPNYYSSGNDPNAPPPNVTDKKQFIWKRLKYDKSQERVYEERIGTSSPEIASLIPAVLTPSSSNCEAVTPELERSPSVTPLHRLDSIQPIA